MIRLIVLDVDGCMSDGGLIYSAQGVESKIFNVKDGLGITTWHKLGHKVAIITGRESEIVKRRAQELGIEHLFQGVKDKKTTLHTLLETLQLQKDEVAAIGDDLNDYAMLQSVGRSFTPYDGVEEIIQIVQTRLSRSGGHGAIREMIDMLIDENGQKEMVISLWIKE